MRKRAATAVDRDCPAVQCTSTGGAERASSSSNNTADSSSPAASYIHTLSQRHFLHAFNAASTHRHTL